MVHGVSSLSVGLPVANQTSDERREKLTEFFKNQAGLTGLKGAIVRKVAVDKTRSSLEHALAAMKVALETHTN
jgi:hypothetical protein